MKATVNSYLLTVRHDSILRRFGSWTSDGSQIDLDYIHGSMITEFYVPNKNLQVVSYDYKINRKTYECCPEPYLDYTATLELKFKA